MIFYLEKMEVYEGEKDLDVIKEKLATGNYLLYAVSTDDNGMVRKEDMVHHAGDKVTLSFSKWRREGSRNHLRDQRKLLWVIYALFCDISILYNRRKYFGRTYRKTI